MAAVVRLIARASTPSVSFEALLNAALLALDARQALALTV
jgi:hypothetical protein